MHISHGGFQYASIRYFNPETKSPGLPTGVSALVSSVNSKSVNVTLGNATKESKKVILQSGGFGEHSFTSVSDGKDESLINSKWLEVEIPAESVVALELGTKRYANSPTYETPFQDSSTWDSLIKPRQLQ